MKKLTYIFAGAAILALCLTACREIEITLPADTSPPVTEPVAYPVDVGSLTILEAPVNVASLSPALTEIICDLGYGDSLTGKSSYCTAGNAAAVNIGSSANPDIDAIKSLAPQLLVSQSPIAKKDVVAMETVGTRVLIMKSPTTYDELFDCYRDIAAMFTGGVNAESVAENALLPLKTAIDGIPKNDYTYAYIVTPDLTVVSEETFLSVFGTNIAADTEDFSMTADELIAANPDVIFLAKPLSASNLPPELSDLTAVRTGMVIPVDNTVLERPTASISALIEDIKAQMANPAVPAVQETAAEETAEAPAEG